jgi:hypothetical protein
MHSHERVFVFAWLCDAHSLQSVGHRKQDAAVSGGSGKLDGTGTAQSQQKPISGLPTARQAIRNKARRSAGFRLCVASVCRLFRRRTDRSILALTLPAALAPKHVTREHNRP